MLPENISEKHTVTVVSFRPISYLLNLSSEIDVVENKYFLRQGLVGQGLSR
jgi:hypothetical protein